MFIIKTKCAICKKFHEARSKNHRTRQQKMKKTKSTKVDDTSFYFVKQTSIKLVVMLCFQLLETHFSLSSVARNEYRVSQNDFQKWISIGFIDFRLLESTSSKSASSESMSSKSSSQELTSSESILCFAVVIIAVFLAVAFAVILAFTFVDVFVQHFMIFSMTSSTHLKWQTMMIQMREQNRQITNFFNVVSQLASFKLKRKLIVIFSSSEDFTFTNIQRVSSKQIVKSTKNAQIIRIEIVKIKRTKIHEKSIEFLIFLNDEKTFLEQESALFVNKHVSFQTNCIDLFINIFSFTNLSNENLSISNQSSFESIVVVAFDFIFAIIFNIFDTFLSFSFIDSVSSLFIENFFSQFTTIILQIFFERARREAR